MLKARGMRVVEQHEVLSKSKGLKKAFQIESFEGVYKDARGDIIDLRPQDSMPCLVNFQKMPLEELRQLLLKAYETQLCQVLEMLEGKRPSYDLEIER